MTRPKNFNAETLEIKKKLMPSFVVKSLTELMICSVMFSDFINEYNTVV